MSTDLDAIRERSRTRRATPSHDCPDRPVVEADIDTLVKELETAHAEVRRLTGNDADLRASADIWCRLYEQSVARANAAERRAELLAQHHPDKVKELYAALDRAARVSEQVAEVIRECEACARNGCKSASASPGTSEACRRCAKALEALKAAGDLR